MFFAAKLYPVGSDLIPDTYQRLIKDILWNAALSGELSCLFLQDSIVHAVVKKHKNTPIRVEHKDNRLSITDPHVEVFRLEIIQVKVGVA